MNILLKMSTLDQLYLFFFLPVSNELFIVSFFQLISLSVIFPFNSFLKFFSFPPGSMQAVSGNGMYTHSVISKLHKCCFECVTGRSEKGLWNRGMWTVSERMDQPFGRAHSKKIKSKCIWLEILVLTKESVNTYVNLFSILLNSPFQYTYLGQSSA